MLLLPMRGPGPRFLLLIFSPEGIVLETTPTSAHSDTQPRDLPRDLIAAESRRKRKATLDKLVSLWGRHLRIHHYPLHYHSRSAATAVTYLQGWWIDDVLFRVISLLRITHISVVNIFNYKAEI